MSSDYYGALAGEIADEGSTPAPEIGQCTYCERFNCLLCPNCGECGDCCQRNADCGGWC